MRRDLGFVEFFAGMKATTKVFRDAGFAAASFPWGNRVSKKYEIAREA
jgi:hypothetical protein